MNLRVPGDQVDLRVFRRKWNEPQREDPYEVVKVTPTAVQVKGQIAWYHINRCTRVSKQDCPGNDHRDTDTSGVEGDQAEYDDLASGNV